MPEGMDPESREMLKRDLALRAGLATEVVEEGVVISRNLQ